MTLTITEIIRPQSHPYDVSLRTVINLQLLDINFQGRLLLTLALNYFPYSREICSQSHQFSVPFQLQTIFKSAQTSKFITYYLWEQ